MRQQGRYIIDKRLVFKRGFQKSFLEEIKKFSNKTWQELANELGVSYFTLNWDWHNENSTLPKRVARKLIIKYPFSTWNCIYNGWVKYEQEPKWGQVKAGSLREKKAITPKNSTKFAEFLGAALGDGHLDHKEFTFSGHAAEIKYLEYVRNLIRTLFHLDSKIFFPKNKNALFMDTYSKALVNILLRNGLKIGNKITKKAEFPRWIFKNKHYASAALRGLFDTDGGIYQKQKSYRRAIIELQTNSPTIHKNILKLFTILDFTPSKGNNREGSFNLRIQKQEEV